MLQVPVAQANLVRYHELRRSPGTWRRSIRSSSSPRGWVRGPGPSWRGALRSVRDDAMGWGQGWAGACAGLWAGALGPGRKIRKIRKIPKTIRKIPQKSAQIQQQIRKIPQDSRTKLRKQSAKLRKHPQNSTQRTHTCIRTQ